MACSGYIKCQVSTVGTAGSLIALLLGCASSAGGLLWQAWSERTMSVPQMSTGDFAAVVHFSGSPQSACTWNTALAETVKTQMSCILVDGWSQAVIFFLQWLERSYGCLLGFDWDLPASLQPRLRASQRSRQNAFLSLWMRQGWGCPCQRERGWMGQGWQRVGFPGFFCSCPFPIWSPVSYGAPCSGIWCFLSQGPHHCCFLS